MQFLPSWARNVEITEEYIQFDYDVRGLIEAFLTEDFLPVLEEFLIGVKMHELIHYISWIDLKQTKSLFKEEVVKFKMIDSEFSEMNSTTFRKKRSKIVTGNKAF